MTATLTTTASTATAPAPAVSAPAVSARTVRRLGLVLVAGSLAWAGAMFSLGANPAGPIGIAVTDLTGLLFQIGVFALLTVQLKTRATGTSRFAVGLLRVEYALLALAAAWSLLHGAVPAFRDDTWLAVLDVFWPLSMLGMFVIGVKIAIAGRWRGAARIWPLVAGSWAVVTVPSMIIFGQGVADLVGPGHLLIGYAALGAVLAARPSLTGAR